MKPETFLTPEKIRDLTLPVWRAFPQVKFAYLYGSLARGDSWIYSDVDIAVYLFPEKPTHLFDLRAALARALKRDDIDLLIMNHTNNIILLEAIIREGVLLFERDPDLRQQFESETLHQAIDFREQRKQIMGL